jgi:hypothetical protein
MSARSSPRRRWYLLAILIAGITANCLAADARSRTGPADSTVMPINAHPRDFGEGWDCNRGFTRQLSRMPVPQLSHRPTHT